MNLKERGGCARANRAPCDTSSYTCIDGDKSRARHRHMKIERPTHGFLERKEQEGKMDEWIIGSPIIVLGLAGRKREVPKQSAGSSLRILWGATLTKYSNPKAQIFL